MTDAEAYISLAKQVILMAGTVEELRLWWRQEADHRLEYGLTRDQEADLLHHIKIAVSLLPEGEPLPFRVPEHREKPLHQRRRAA